MNVSLPFEADGEAADLGEPGQPALQDPPVPAQTLAALDAAAVDAVLDAPSGGTDDSGGGLRLVGVQLRGTLAW